MQCLFCPDYFFPTCKIDGKSLNLNWGIHFFQQRVEQKCFFLLTIRQYNKGWHFKSTLNWMWQCRWLEKTQMVSSTKKAALFSLYSMVHRYCHWINSRLKTVYFIISWLICLQTKLFNAIFYLDANLKNPRHVPFSILQLALKLSNDKKSWLKN